MKRLMILLFVFAILLSSNSACKKCKNCHSEIMGVKGPAIEMCGEQLDQAEKTPTMVCE